MTTRGRPVRPPSTHLRVDEKFARVVTIMADRQLLSVPEFTRIWYPELAKAENIPLPDGPVDPAQLALLPTPGASTKKLATFIGEAKKVAKARVAKKAVTKKSKKVAKPKKVRGASRRSSFVPAKKKKARR